MFWRIPKYCNFIKKDTLAQVFSCEICEISNNTLSTEHPRKTASEYSKATKTDSFTNFVPFFYKGIRKEVSCEKDFIKIS